MKLKVMAGNLTAHANLHGTHFDNYLTNKTSIAKILSEQLILHDQINIPIIDFLTACGLIAIIGESNFISLLEANQLRFIKYRGNLTFLKSVNMNADFGISTPQEPHPWSSPLDISLEFSIRFLEERFPVKEKDKLKKLIINQTDLVDLGAHLDQIRSEVFELFKHTEISKKPFNDFLENKEIGRVTAHVLGDSPTDYQNPISVIQALMNFRFETNLKEQFECQNLSPTKDFSDLISLRTNNSEKLWHITELYDIPDLASLILAGGNECQSFIKLTQSDKASCFREWFQSSGDADPKVLRREFIGLMDNEPWFKRTIGSYICWGTVVLTGMVHGPLAGVPLSFLNKLLGKVKGKSPKYFITELEKLNK